MSTRQQHAQQTHHPHKASSPSSSSSSSSSSSGPATASASAESPCAPFSPPPSPPHPQQAPPPGPNLNRDDQQVISDILAKDDFYARLGVTRDASTQKIRSAYLRRSKICHPDRQKHPSAKEAFQRLSTAYTTLSEPVNRRQYDLFGKSVDGSDTTFSDALRKVFDEFLEGEYDSIMALVDQIQTLNPEIHISREGTRTVLSSMRDLCLWGGRCWSGARGEVVGLVEMHNDIQRLPFLDFRGRLAKTATLSKGIICAVAKCVPAGGVVLEKSMPGIERCEMFFV
ncbi:DnaJ domain-containing protein [Geranomyces variabilis]|nr:DnaJ domain-containing protein [Geranomyces variabilis]